MTKNQSPTKSSEANESERAAQSESAASIRRLAVGKRRTEKISEVVAREIVRDCRGLPPGTMLPPEARLLELYRVSRPSLREALRLLEVQGLIIMRPGPGGGPMVAEPDSQHFGRMASLFLHMSCATYRNTLEARLMVEPVVAATIARRQDPEDIQALRDYIENFRTNLAGKLPPTSFEISEKQERILEFHAMLMNMSRNPVVELFVRSLQDMRVDNGLGHTEELEEKFLHVHDEIAQAIIDGQAEHAADLMREHIEDFIRYGEEHDPSYLEQIVSWR